jgi:hypothetical protein
MFNAGDRRPSSRRLCGRPRFLGFSPKAVLLTLEPIFIKQKLLNTAISKISLVERPL